MLNGEPVTSLYGAAVLNPSVIPSETITHKNLHVSELSFFLIMNFSSVMTSNYRQKYSVSKSVAIKRISGSVEKL
jgi:hypothetical protein